MRPMVGEMKDSLNKGSPWEIAGLAERSRAGWKELCTGREGRVADGLE